jgi:hypothetical protein
MNPLLVEALGSIIRAGLMILAGYLVKHGIWTDSDAANYVSAAALAIIGLGWSIWQKYKNRLTLVTALSGGPMTENDAKMLSQMPGAPSVATPKDRRPL